MDVTLELSKDGSIPASHHPSLWTRATERPQDPLHFPHCRFGVLFPFPFRFRTSSHGTGRETTVTPNLLSSPSLPLSAFTPERRDQQEQLQMQNIRFSFCREFNAEPLIAAPRGAASVSSAMPCAISALISQQFSVYCKWSCTSVFIRSTQLRLRFVSACLSGGENFFKPNCLKI